MDLISTEGPILLGYLAVAAVIGLLGLITLLLDPDVRRRRAVNAALRASRKADARYRSEAHR